MEHWAVIALIAWITGITYSSFRFRSGVRKLSDGCRSRATAMRRMANLVGELSEQCARTKKLCEELRGSIKYESDGSE